MKPTTYAAALLAAIFLVAAKPVEATTPLRKPGESVPLGPLAKETWPSTKAAPKHIPILALYTPKRLGALGGLTNLTAQLNDELASLNDSLRVSGLFDYDFTYAAIQPAGYDDSGTLSEDLAWLESNWPSSRINAAGARLVHLFTRSGQDAAGISGGFRVNGWPSVSAVPEYAQAGIFVMAHEVGHNLGLNHDPENTAEPVDWPNSHAFRKAGYRDVMAYSNNCFERFGQDCPIFAGFSDPARLKDGQTLGVPGVSEAVTVLRTTLPYLAGDANCYPSSESLCLNGNRFRVYATWETPDGATALGTAIPRTSDSGEFWFFAASNIELVVKVLTAAVSAAITGSTPQASPMCAWCFRLPTP